MMKITTLALGVAVALGTAPAMAGHGGGGGGFHGGGGGFHGGGFGFRGGGFGFRGGFRGGCCFGPGFGFGLGFGALAWGWPYYAPGYYPPPPVYSRRRSIMPLRLPGIGRRRAMRRKATRPRGTRPKGTHPGLRAGLCVVSATLCAAAPSLATAELSTAGILSAALPGSLRPRSVPLCRSQRPLRPAVCCGEPACVAPRQARRRLLSTATAWTSPEGHLLQLAFEVHEPGGSAHKLVHQDGCAGNFHQTDRPGRSRCGSRT